MSALAENTIAFFFLDIKAIKTTLLAILLRMSDLSKQKQSKYYKLFCKYNRSARFILAENYII